MLSSAVLYSSALSVVRLVRVSSACACSALVLMSSAVARAKSRLESPSTLMVINGSNAKLSASSSTLARILRRMVRRNDMSVWLLKSTQESKKITKAGR
jgi:hypothetical protein